MAETEMFSQKWVSDDIPRYCEYPTSSTVSAAGGRAGDAAQGQAQRAQLREGRSLQTRPAEGSAAGVLLRSARRHPVHASPAGEARYLLVSRRVRRD